MTDGIRPPGAPTLPPTGTRLPVVRKKPAPVQEPRYPEWSIWYRRPAGYTATDYRSQPNYERLSQWERMVVSRLPGFAQSSVGQALQKFNQTAFGKALVYLDIGAEAVERGTGFVTQAAAAFGDPEAWDDFSSHLSEAWYAGSLAADMGRMPTFEFATAGGVGGAGLGFVFGGLPGAFVGAGVGGIVGMAAQALTIGVPADLPAIEGLVQTRRRIADLTAQGIDAGDALVQARDEYYESLGALAIRAQMQDMFVHIWGDPINVVGAFIKPWERVLVGRILAEGKAVPGSIAEETALAARALEEATVGGDAARIAEATEGLAALSELREMSWAEQKLLQFAGELPFEGRWAFLNRLSMSRWNPLGLTPGSRAYEHVTQVQDNIAAYIIPRGDPEDIAATIGRAYRGTLGPEMGHMIVSPSGRAVRGNLAGISAVSDDLIGVWRTTTGERSLVQVVARAIGETDTKLIAMLENGESAGVLQRLFAAAAVNPELGRALDNVLEGQMLTRAALTPQVLDGAASILRDVPYTPEMFRWMLLNKTADVVAQSAISLFGVNARGLLVKAGEALKAAETLAFLRTNAAYPIRNWINNELTTMTRLGVGFTDLAWCEDLWRTLGFEPPRLRVGFGMAGLPEAERAGGRGMDIATEIIQAAERGTPGWIDRARSFFSRVNLGKLDMGTMARSIEARASMRATTNGYMRVWRQVWPAMMPKVADVVPEIAEQLGPDFVRTIENAALSGMTDAQVRTILETGDLGTSNYGVIQRASEALGVDIANVMPAEEIEAITGRLTTAARGRYWRNAIREEGRAIRTQTQERLAQMIDDAMPDVIAETVARVQTEGPGAYPRVFGEMWDDWWGARSRWTMEVSEGAEFASTLPPEAANAAWEAVVEQGGRFHTRLWNRLEARSQAMVTGLDQLTAQLDEGGRMTPELRAALRNAESGLMTNFRQWRDGWNQFFDFRNTETRNFFRARLEGKEYRLGYDQLVSEINTRYDGVMAIEVQRLEAMDNLVADMVPAAERAAFDQWRGAVRNLRIEDMNLVRGFREQIRGLTRDERLALYPAHWQQRRDLWQRIGRLDTSLPPGATTGAAADPTQGLVAQMATRLEAIQAEQGLAGGVYPGSEWIRVVEAARARPIVGGLAGDAATAQLLDEFAGAFGVTRAELEQALIAGRMPGAAAAAGAQIPAVGDFHGIVPRELFMGSGWDELMYTRGNDVIDALERAALEARQRPALRLADLTADQQTGLRRWLDIATGRMGDARYASIRGAEAFRDTALLNYNRRFNYNTWLGVLMPYEFWMTQTATKWALTLLDNYYVPATYLRLQQFLNTGWRPESGLPDRLRGTVRFAMPFLPEAFRKWAGRDIFVDPLGTALPFDQMTYWHDALVQQDMRSEGAASRILQQMLEDGQISQADYDGASRSHSGPVWERAITLAIRDNAESRLSGFDFMSMFTSPHAPILWGLNAARGTPERIQPFLPITRTIRGVTAALGIGPNRAGVNIEGAIRRELGLPEFDQWDDYRTMRMLASMVFAGEISVDEEREAMTARQGAAWNEAERRAAQEYAVGAIGSFLGIPAKAYPKGEEARREMRALYEDAWRSYDAGDEDALKRFYEEHPEYEAAVDLGYWDEPESMRRRFLVDELWETWNSLPDLHKREVSEQLGATFEQAFLDRETRSYDSVPLEVLAAWAQVMRGDPPGTLMPAPGFEVRPLDLAPQAVAIRAQQFYDLRDRWFPGWYDLQSDYFRLDEGNARRAYLTQHPALRDYWYWRNDWLMKNPQVAPYLTDEPPTYPSEEALRQAQAQQWQMSPQEWQPYLGNELYRLLQDYSGGLDLPRAAMDRLEQIAEEMGVTPEFIIMAVTGQ